MAVVGERCDLCGRNDFLPLRCSLCSRLLCTEHMAPFAHECAGRVEVVRTDRPEAVGLAAALAANMDQVSRRFDGEQHEWSQRQHYRVKGSAAAGMTRPENRFLRAYREKLAASGTMDEKNRRISAQVRNMLLKSKAKGRSSLHPDDRFYLEIRFGGVDADGDDEGSAATARATGTAKAEVVDYMYVSRLWTVGRTLDEIVAKHKDALRSAYGTGEAQRYVLLNERTGWLLALGKAMAEAGEDELKTCDTVIVLPFTEEEPGGDGTELQERVDTCPQVHRDRMIVDEDGVRQIETAVGFPSENVHQAVASSGDSEVAAAPDGGPRLDALSGDFVAQDAHVASNGVAGVITIVQGKQGYDIGFTQQEWDTLMVEDLKIRIESLTGVRRARQKLVYKGILNSADKLAATKLRHGARVTLMTAGK